MGPLETMATCTSEEKNNKTKRCSEDMYSWAFSYTFRHNISSEMDKWSLFAKALWRR